MSSPAIVHLHIPDDGIPDLNSLITSIKEETADRLAMSPNSVEVIPHRFAAPSHKHGSSFKITIIVEASLTSGQRERLTTLSDTLATTITSRNQGWLSVATGSAPEKAVLLRIDDKPVASWATGTVRVTAQSDAA